MKTAIKIINTTTGIEFVPNKELEAHAKSYPETFKIVYAEDASEPEEETFSSEQLQGMSVPELRKIADGLECDKRNKDSMISAILKSRG